MPAQTPLDRSRPPLLPAAPKPGLPKIQSQTLPNGLVLDVVEMHKAPIIDVTVVFRAGSTRDPAELPGLATFVAGMLDEGAGKRSSPEISEEIDYLGAELSAAAGIEIAQVHLHALKSTIDEALDVAADVALRPTFPDIEIARQRELRKTHLLQLRDQPTAIAPQAFNEHGRSTLGARFQYEGLMVVLNELGVVVAEAAGCLSALLPDAERRVALQREAEMLLNGLGSLDLRKSSRQERGV